MCDSELKTEKSAYGWMADRPLLRTFPSLNCECLLCEAVIPARMQRKPGRCPVCKGDSKGARYAIDWRAATGQSAIGLLNPGAFERLGVDLRRVHSPSNLRPAHLERGQAV